MAERLLDQTSDETSGLRQAMEREPAAAGTRAMVAPADTDVGRLHPAQEQAQVQQQMPAQDWEQEGASQAATTAGEAGGGGGGWGRAVF